MRIILMIILALVTTNALASQSKFFQEEKRGWLWFEEKPKDDEEKSEKDQPSRRPTLQEMEKAEQENESFARELELTRHMMIRHPDNLEYIKAYKEKEQKMLDASMALARNYAMVNMLHPELADNLKQPQNMYGRSLKRDEEKEIKKRTLLNLAKEVELFVFIREDCIYCQTLQEHLQGFASMYGFKVEAIAADNSTSKYFKTNTAPELIKALDLKVMPTVILVTNDSSLRYELARGAVSIPDLEDRAMLVAQDLKNRMR